MRKAIASYILIILFALPVVGQRDKKESAPAPVKTALDFDTYFKPVKWRSIGPFRGGRSVTATGVVGDVNTYYMGTTGGGVWKTDDLGITWKNSSDGFFKTGSVGAVSVSESDPNVALKLMRNSPTSS